MIELRPYQKKAVQKNVEFFKKKKTKPSIFIAPVASGKSLIIGKTIKEK